MLARAHELGLRVIVDIVPNHTSSAHPWFLAALSAPPGSPERDRYLFRDTTNDWESIFGGAAWTRVPDGQYYLHLFDPSQPDLNWRNEEVRAEFESILRFWLDRGVDGFRIDVAHGMVKAVGLPSVGHSGQISLLGRAVLPYFDQDEVHDIYRAWRKILDSYPGDRMAVAEAWASTPERLARYVAPDELHQAFNFDLLDAAWSALDIRETIDRCMAVVATVGAPTTWVLSNHDKQRHPTRYGTGDRARAAALLMLALPGSAYLYQGEELGLPEVLDLPDDCRQDPMWFRSAGAEPGRDGCRVPMPWSGDAPPYGFSDTGAAWLPSPASWAPLTAQAQAGDPDSTLSLYRQALRLRRSRRAGTTPVAAGHGAELVWHEAPAHVLDFTGRGGVRCVVNLGVTPVPLPADGADVLLASGSLAAGQLPPDTAVWL
jgi:alpha-glucosidase